MGIQNATIDEIVPALGDQRVFSWTFDPEVAFSHGVDSIITRTRVQLDQIIITDRLNNPGIREGQDEVLFKLDNFLEVIGASDESGQRDSP